MPARRKKASTANIPLKKADYCHFFITFAPETAMQRQPSARELPVGMNQPRP